MLHLLFDEAKSGNIDAGVTLYTDNPAEDIKDRDKVQRILVGHHPTSKMVVMPAK